jgi:5-hydroxyisourate hydrolase
LRDLGPDQVPAGTYRITFETGAWFEAAGRATFYPQVAVTFTVSEDHQHCHVPVLLSPFAFSTYRGS